VSEKPVAPGLGVNLDLAKLPRSDEEALERAARWQSKDPFPDVAPALLNSADLFDYIAAIGMIHPFKVDPSNPAESLKPASCGIRLGGECLYWEYEDGGPGDRKPVKRVENLGSGVKEIELPSNSIVYATLAPMFRLPDYIAARFNLNIYYVYRGLLVGTGPLVDPGFKGHLTIPLHNLTARPCTIQAGEVVLWMEFTKLSPNTRWSGEAPRREDRSGQYVPFPPWKLARGGVGEYLEKQHGNKPIISSIPDEIEKAKLEAEKAAREARRTRRYAKWFELAAAAALIFGVIGLVGFIVDVSHNISSDSDSAQHRVNEVEAKLTSLQAEVGKLKAEGQDVPARSRIATPAR
jgi:deoxycytidine triphosphate deaminase/preprotein translocase subunit Sss1